MTIIIANCQHLLLHSLLLILLQSSSLKLLVLCEEIYLNLVSNVNENLLSLFKGVVGPQGEHGSPVSTNILRLYFELTFQE